MSENPNFDTELLTEHFGYPPVSLVDDIINSINILAESALRSIEHGLLRSPPAALGFRPPPKSRAKATKPGQAAQTYNVEESAKFEIENGTHQLETLLCSSIDRNFDIFELYVMRNILKIPADVRDWIRLAHYDGLDFSFLEEASPDDGSASNGANHRANTLPNRDTVVALHRRLQASQRLQCLLEQEHAQNAALLARLRTVVGAPADDTVKDEPRRDESEDSKKSLLGFLCRETELSSMNARKPLQTTVAFTLSQLASLRSLSSSLHDILPVLYSGQDEDDGDDPAADDDSDKTLSQSERFRRERVKYIEAGTRKHLEGVRGLELGAQGDVRDGEWQWPGRAYGKTEVEAMERAVAGLLDMDVDERVDGNVGGGTSAEAAHTIESGSEGESRSQDNSADDGRNGRDTRDGSRDSSSDTTRPTDESLSDGDVAMDES